MDIFFYETFEEEAAKIQQYLPEQLEAGFTWKTIQEYAAASPPAPLISIRTQSVIPAEWNNALSGILSRSTGYDHLLRYRKSTGAGFPMGYLPLYCHRAVAEQALLLMLALTRKFPSQVKNFKTFHRDGLTGGEVLDKTMAVVGVGNIGSQVVMIGSALGMHVMPVDIERKFPDLKYYEPKEAMKKADFVICAMNLTEDNHGYFDYETLRQMPRGAFFVNISRGELAVSEDLLKLLDEKHLAGIGIDVYEVEKELAVSLRSGKISPNPKVKAIQHLADRDNVIMTPHNAFNTAEGVERKSKQSVEQVVQFLEKGMFAWPVPEE